MKTELNLSYKRVQSKPNSIDFNRIKTIKQLFIDKILKKITSDTLVINIDKALINRYIKINY